MRRVQRGDTAAFALLYERLAPGALAVARGILAEQPDRAHDAVQDAFLSIWRFRDRYRAELGRVESWAFTIVRNRARDSRRHHHHHDRRRTDAEGVLENLRSAEDVEADLVVRTDTARLRGKLAGLPPAQREVITLAYFGQLTQREISERLEVPIGTVKGRVRLGFARLQGELAA